MIGQRQLQNRLSKYSLSTLPHVMLFVGEKGCGKHFLVKELANKFNVKYINLSRLNEDELKNLTEDHKADFILRGYSKTDALKEAKELVSKQSAKILDTIRYELIPEARLLVSDTIYLIDLDTYDLDKTTHVGLFLKFLEEPNPKAHIIMLTSNELSVPTTILNRCTKYYFEPYAQAELKEICAKSKVPEIVYNVCTTPGQIEKADVSMIDSLLKLCKTIVDHIQDATYANTLSLSTKINCKDNYDKYDFDLFFKALTYTSFNDYLETGKDQSYKIYDYTIKYIQKPCNNKEAYLLNYFAGLSHEVH